MGCVGCKAHQFADDFQVSLDVTGFAMRASQNHRVIKVGKRLIGMGNTADNIQRVALGDVLDISLAAELKVKLLEAVEQGGNIVFEAADVERADTSVLQLLLAFVQDVRSQGREVLWEEASDALLRAAELIGVDSLMGLAVEKK
jgi:anti-anti-sigma regulatory factor